MKLNKSVVRILAVVMVALMSVSVMGCISSYNQNPMVAKVGSVKLYLQQYISLYNNTDTNANPFYMYLQYGLINDQQYAEYILDELVDYGVQLDQLEVQNITLNEEEEAKLQQDVDDNIRNTVTTTYLPNVGDEVTGEEARYDAAYQLFLDYLKSQGTTFEKYRAGIEDNLRLTARLNKLRELAVADVVATNDDVKDYIESNTKTDTTVSSFYSAWSGFLGMSTKAMPLFMPHPERAVEDDPETADKDESKEADPFQEFFTVQHMLIKFTTEAGESVTDLEEYGAGDKAFTEMMNDFDENIGSLTAEEFLEKCHDKGICGDPGMLNPTYQYFGYLMQEGLISSYYPGFGYASMKLRFGEDWKSSAEKKDGDSETGENAGEPEYNVVIMDLADGTQVAKVYTTVGVHYIIINTNDTFSMYDEDGYLMLPLYDGEEVVTDGEGIVTAHGHMTQEQFDAINEILSNVKPAPADEEEGEEGTDATEEETEEAEPITLKSIYDYYHDTKLSSMQDEVYNEKFKEWRNSTKIVKKTNLIKSFYLR